MRQRGQRDRGMSAVCIQGEADQTGVVEEVLEQSHVAEEDKSGGHGC